KKVLMVLSIVILGSLGALLLAGCGGSKQSSAPAENKQTQQKPKYTVAMEASFAPFEFRDEKTGELKGFDVDLMNAIAKAEGFDVDYKDMGFDGIIASVQTGSVDMAISGISITDKRKEQVDFSLPYYMSGLAIAVSKDNNTIKSIKDLEGKRIAVQIATTGADYAAKIPGAKITTFDHVTEALMEIKNGGADALINDYPVSYYYIKMNGNKDFKILKERITSEPYGIIVKKGNTKLLNMINDGLLKLKKSGEYAKIYKKWFDEEPPAYLPGEPK
ncbi:MAG: basic amino acid ABC transporter substrate-binding protein, partial [Thermacetogeniaceae bacterium]